MRQLLIFDTSNFNWPAGLHLWSNSSTTTTTTSWLLVLVSLVLCWRNMTTVYSSPYKVGLIYVGTMFAQSSCRLLVSEVAFGKFSYTVILVRRFAASANLAPHQSAQVIMEQGLWIFFYLKRLDFRVSAFRFFFRFSIRFAICFRIRLRKNVKAWYRRYFDSKPPNIPAFRRGDPGVFHSRCQGL